MRRDGQDESSNVEDARASGGGRRGSVRLELQADCFAAVGGANRSQAEQGWKLGPGDIETALHAAAQIGDNTLQRKARGQAVLERFSHETAARNA